MRLVPARAALVGALFAALVTFPGLGGGTLWDNSETAYGEVAREIVLTHDWVVMHLNGQPWFIQPPLYFWISAIIAKMIGVSTLAVRLPSALATILMGGAVGYATGRIAGARAGILAAVVLSTSLMQAIVGRLAIMDALLDLTVTAAILWWFRALEPTSAGPTLDAGKRSTAFLLGAASLALGTLAKGPVAPVIVILVVGVWLILERRNATVLMPRLNTLIGALAIYLAIVAPWFVALLVRVGPHAATELIGHYTIGRYTGVIENQRGPWWYYVPVLILGFFPWIAFAPFAAKRVFDEARAPDGSLSRLVLVWALVPLIFFSFAQTKLPNYIALTLPALAIIVALWFERVVAGADRRAAIISAATIPIFVGMVAIAITAFSNSNALEGQTTTVLPELTILGVGMLVGSLITVFAIARPAFTAWSPYVLAVTSGALVLFIALVAEPIAETLKPIPHFATLIEQQRVAGDVVAIRGVAGGNGLVFYTHPGVRALDDDTESYDALICSSPRIFLVTRAKDAAMLTADARAHGRSVTPLGVVTRVTLLRIDGSRCAATRHA